MAEPIMRPTRGKGFGCTWKCSECGKPMKNKAICEHHILKKHR